ncbi:hypothetical protein [Methanosarcina barkeri]|uniref:hypothetical protein n=1 Tax=Methanosarcina barkeri TaxID=2208 RepID=UPI00064EEF04|nr:hypothetical protein [Methanosarcina barkeri]
MHNDPVLWKCFDNQNPQPSTENNSWLAIKYLTELTAETPEELLTEAEQEVKSGKLMRQCSIKKYLIAFIKYSDEIIRYKNVSNWIYKVFTRYKDINVMIVERHLTGMEFK